MRRAAVRHSFRIDPRQADRHPRVPLGPPDLVVASAGAWTPLCLSRTPRGILFGNTAVGSRLASSQPGSAQAFAFRIRAAGMLRSINVFIDPNNAAPVVMAGLYSNDHGHPGRRLTSGEVASTKTGTWHKVFVRPMSAASGRIYWVALLGERGRLYVRGRSSRGCVSENFRRGGLAGLPKRWRSGGRSSMCSISAFG